ncbi:MAG: hypothetical protein J7M18_05400, partial [Candidatus Eremiobacteraeota bacterium]|nr:hypothetical protein [Candidatus Eremiobacteraeota bacterium]
MRIREKASDGLTLVEIMIIIIVIGLLMSIVLPVLVKARYHSQFTACVLNLRKIGKALENYQTNHSGHYPSNLDILFKQKYLPRKLTCPSYRSEY